MNLKLIIALVIDDYSEDVLHAARLAGATGSTLISNARGSGFRPKKTFLGLDLTDQSDVLLFLVEAGKASAILETINQAGRFDEESGTGMAFQIDVENAVGIASQISAAGVGGEAGAAGPVQ